MINKKIIKLAIFSAIALAGCSSIMNNSGNQSNVDPDTSGATDVSELSIPEDTITTSFSLKDINGDELTPSGGVYTILQAGNYFASGKLENGQINVNVSAAEVILEFDNVSISSNSVSPIYVTSADTFKLKAKNDTVNFVYDRRTTDYSQTTTTDGTGAIFASNGDLELVGKGTLYVYSYQNSGIHGKDNVKVKNQTLFVRAQNNGIKGNDKVTIEEEPYIDIYADNNGITTSKSDVGSSAQHGYIYLNGGKILINSNGDGVDAAYSLQVETSTNEDGETISPDIAIYTGKYSAFYNTTVSSLSAVKYAPPGQPGGMGQGGMGPGGGTSGESSAEKSDTSAKGLKAANAINVTTGNIYVQAYDDGLHANNDSLESGAVGTGAIAISGGTLNIYCSDDAVHADGALLISNGTVNVMASHEGIEGKVITVSGGKVKVSPVYTTDSWGVTIATDDAINASTSLTISGGLVDASVNPNGDYDCIDSNGTITISGGVVIARGPNSGMAGAIDCDGAFKMTAGTLVYCGSIEAGSKSISTSSKSVSVHSSGSHTLTVGGTEYNIKNSYSYSSTTCYSDTTVSAS